MTPLLWFLLGVALGGMAGITAMVIITSDQR